MSVHLPSLEQMRELDAGTIATGILQAGRTITEKFSAKTSCFSASSRNCAAGIVRNPINPARNTWLGLSAPTARGRSPNGDRLRSSR
jgi:hypothetical protein